MTMSAAERESAHRRETRLEEMRVLRQRAGEYLQGSELLEIGSGDGTQLAELAKHCQAVRGIDVAESPYATSRIAEISNYDGRTIPFADRSFDVVFSSNVLEHIAHLQVIQQEIARVLRPGGVAIHILPTHHWRLWTTLSHYPTMWRPVEGQVTVRRSLRSRAIALADALVAPRHGTRGTRFTEYFYFRPAWWAQQFQASGWKIALSCPVGLFYTGHRWRGPKLGMNRRRALARWLGSATHLFVLQPPSAHAPGRAPGARQQR